MAIFGISLNIEEYHYCHATVSKNLNSQMRRGKTLKFG
jgi:hypothetical protein